MKLILSDRPLPLELSGHPDVVCVDLTRLKIACLDRDARR